MTNILNAIILGIVQGIAEFLPISSSGHLLLFRHFMNLKLSIIFDIYLHLATVLVIIIYYRQRILELFLTFIRFVLRKTGKSDLENLRLMLLILIITIVTGVVGTFISKYERIFTLPFVLINFIITGILILILEFNFLKIDFKGNILLVGIFMGLMQGLGVLPGISRSGVTIFSALVIGFNRKSAFEISFLSLIPIVFGAILLKHKEFYDIFMVLNFFEINLGALVAFVVGIFSINFFFKMLNNKKLYYFSIYLFALSSIVYYFFRI
ncbi:undecaprenyl-diphosphate phosphatase [Borreliella californiensis]|uniref:Undecaprenyl-diphosphatase n=1 Tax=Borreliella californiensis TaxID=373543 RepID=A0A7W9ZKA7_9SPIR|nr:undecaprenyl-diphosphate phosphatase [Borreliella californiensis]MBB6213112.1 undecaprenyl-diphosphatase [Borreliella californiensis]WKC91559.1 undecaprenyl-diphosphate phosphatase [Borreliella californiensis]WNY70315.1 undecaprenyl-diphosphate phosphatase [Borreliella californiensis]